MKIISDFAGYQATNPAVKADASPRTVNAKAPLYQSSASAQTTASRPIAQASVASPDVTPASAESGYQNVYQITGRWINNKANGIPVVQNVVKPIGDAILGFGNQYADLADGVGAPLIDTGRGLVALWHGNGGEFLHDVYDSGKDAVHGAVDAVKDAADTVKNIVSDLFSW